MQDPLRHEALPYKGHEQFVSSSVSLVRDGLDRDERLIFLAAQAKLDDVRDALGPDAEEIAMVDTDEHGRNPCRITTMLHSFQAGGDGRRSFGISETVFPGRKPAALLEAQLAESVLNAPALQRWPLSVVCLYDTSELEPAALVEMRRSHPVIRGEDDENADYDEDLLSGHYGASLGARPAGAARLAVAGPRLTPMREFVRSAAVGYGIAPDRVDDLVLAANEIVTNSLRYAHGHCVVHVWQDDASAVCEVQDSGYLADPLVGRIAPPPDAASGRGLWLSNHLCDLVQIRSSTHGTVVRLFVDG
jgi:anti-sigma regulatory factor (Ser/Thr protein kinase)